MSMVFWIYSLLVFSRLKTNFAHVKLFHTDSYSIVWLRLLYKCGILRNNETTPYCIRINESIVLNLSFVTNYLDLEDEGEEGEICTQKGSPFLSAFFMSPKLEFRNRNLRWDGRRCISWRCSISCEDMLRNTASPFISLASPISGIGETSHS